MISRTPWRFPPIQRPFLRRALWSSRCCQKGRSWNFWLWSLWNIETDCNRLKHIEAIEIDKNLLPIVQKSASASKSWTNLTRSSYRGSCVKRWTAVWNVFWTASLGLADPSIYTTLQHVQRPRTTTWAWRPKRCPEPKSCGAFSPAAPRWPPWGEIDPFDPFDHLSLPLSLPGWWMPGKQMPCFLVCAGGVGMMTSCLRHHDHHDIMIAMPGAEVFHLESNGAPLGTWNHLPVSTMFRKKDPDSRLTTRKQAVLLGFPSPQHIYIYFYIYYVYIHILCVYIHIHLQDGLHGPRFPLTLSIRHQVPPSGDFASAGPVGS